MEQGNRVIEYNGEKVEVRGGAWCDEMNSWLYTVIERDVVVNGKEYCICREREADGGKLFAI